MGDTLTKQFNANAGRGGSILQWLGPAILAVASAYGTVQYAAGRTQTRLDTVEQESKQTKQDLERAGDKTISREEFRQFIDATREDLREIKTDVREIRKGLK